MTIESDLVAVLQGTGLTVYPGSAPEGATYPCVVFQRISTDPMRSHAGKALERPRIQLSVWGKKYVDVLTAAETVEIALDLNQTDFKLAAKVNELDLKDVETGLHRRVIDYFIWD